MTPPPNGREPAKKHDVIRIGHECIHCGAEPRIRISIGFAKLVGIYVFDHGTRGLALTSRCHKCGRIDEIPVQALARDTPSVQPSGV